MCGERLYFLKFSKGDEAPRVAKCGWKEGLHTVGASIKVPDIYGAEKDFRAGLGVIKPKTYFTMRQFVDCHIVIRKPEILYFKPKCSCCIS
jgi:hypothetical protein